MKIVLPLALIMLLTSACHKDNGPCLTCPPPYIQSIVLDTPSAELTTVEFQMHTTDSTHLGIIQLYRDTVSLFSKTILSIDTTIIDTALLPAHHYRYKAYRLTGTTTTDSSAAIVLTTMDTTSHNFTWQIDTLGDGSSSVLNDVAVINDTLVYSVGEIWLRDSSGNFINPPFNFACWDGYRWHIDRSSDIGYLYGALYSVFAFGPNDVWTGSTIPEHWDGTRWTFYGVARGFPTGFYIKKIWGTSSHNIYVVGTGGNIVSYDGQKWQKLESGTTLDIQDIWGSLNQKTGEWEILAVAGNPGASYDRKILQVSGSTVSTISDSSINWPLSGVWFMPSHHYYVVGSGIYEKHHLSDTWWKNGPLDITTYYTNAIRGNDLNDVFFCGAYGDMFHFNGASWHSYLSETRVSDGAYYAVAANSSLVIAVGEDNPLAIVALGKRN